MANAKLLGDLRTSAFRRASMEGSSFVGRWEANEFINAGGSELHDLIVKSYRDYYKSDSSITLVSGTENYALPTDFYKLKSAYYLQGGIRRRLDQFMLDELTDYESDRVLPLVSGEHLLYRLMGNEIIFTPKPSSAATIELWYTPQFTPLVDPFEDDGATPNGAYVSGDDLISYAIVNGWEEYLILYATIRMLQKEESDASTFMAQLASLAERIKSMASNRDSGKPQRVQDVYTRRRRGGRRGLGRGIR